MDYKNAGSIVEYKILQRKKIQFSRLCGYRLYILQHKVNHLK